MEEVFLKWERTDLDENATRATHDWWVLETRSEGDGVVWGISLEVNPNAYGDHVTGSFDADWNPQPVATLRQAQFDAERALRGAAERIVARLSLGGSALSRLGLRRVPPQPTSAGEIAIDAMFEALRDVVENVGGLVITGMVQGVRESRARNVYFVLRSGRCSLSCRMSSTQAKAIGRPVEGSTMRVRGVPTVFTERGEVQFDVLGIEKAEAE